MTLTKRKKKYQRESTVAVRLFQLIGLSYTSMTDPQETYGGETGTDVEIHYDGHRIGIQVTEFSADEGAVLAKRGLRAATAYNDEKGKLTSGCIPLREQVPALARRIRKKIEKSELYDFKQFDEVWLLVATFVPWAPVATFQLPGVTITLKDLNWHLNDELRRSNFTRVFVYNMLGKTVYEWSSVTGWRCIQENPAAPASTGAELWFKPYLADPEIRKDPKGWALLEADRMRQQTSLTTNVEDRVTSTTQSEAIVPEHELERHKGMPMNPGFSQHWSEWLDRHIWPQIYTMLLHDCFFKLMGRARELTGEFSGPIGWHIEVGYVTWQAMAIRRLCDRRRDVISLARLLVEAKSKNIVQKPQIDELFAKLKCCDDVCNMANNYIAHTGDPRRRQNLSEWKLLADHLTEARKAICEVVVTLDHDLLKRTNPFEIMPVPQYNFTQEFESWVGAGDIQKLHKYFHEYRRAVNAWVRHT